MKSILDPSFHYTSSGQTDIRKTFERVWRELRVREGPERTSVPEHNRPRRGRNGEALNVGWFDAVVIRESAPGIEVITCVPLCRLRAPTDKSVLSILHQSESRRARQTGSTEQDLNFALVPKSQR
jgi:hypothetical protein